MSGHLLASGFFAPELWPQAAVLEQGQIGRRAVGRVGPHIAGGVVVIKHRTELAAIMRRRVRHTVAPKKAVFAVDVDMVLVPEYRHRDLDLSLVVGAGRGLGPTPTLDRPASIAVDLGASRRLSRMPQTDTIAPHFQ
jgi:hypothetical protein